jgi:hypothetical protein
MNLFLKALAWNQCKTLADGFVHLLLCKTGNKKGGLSISLVCQ